MSVEYDFMKKKEKKAIIDRLIHDFGFDYEKFKEDNFDLYDYYFIITQKKKYLFYLKIQLLIDFLKID